METLVRKEIPMLFSTPMVQAILEGRKTQTRRVVKGMALEWLAPDMFTPEYVAHPDNNLCPYGKVGDVIWVRETWVKGFISENGETPKEGEEKRFWYYADNDWTKLDWHHPDKEGPQSSPRWKPSIHMPKDAARIWLEVTSIKVERLQDISEEDADREGIEVVEHNCYRNYMIDKDWMYDGRNQKDYHFLEDSVGSFASLWTKINGEESWNANPFVWVVSFNVISKTGKPF